MPELRRVGIKWRCLAEAVSATAGEVEEVKTRIAALATLGLVFAACSGGSSPLQKAYDTCSSGGYRSGIELADQGRSILIDGEPQDSTVGASISDIFCVLDALDVPDSVIARMERTTALQGQQEATWSGLIARWTYHPDNGLDIIIEMSE
jgi:hypothetical protein